jgi:hypothetical protein
VESIFSFLAFNIRNNSSLSGAQNDICNWQASFQIEICSTFREEENTCSKLSLHGVLLKQLISVTIRCGWIESIVVMKVHDLCIIVALAFLIIARTNSIKTKNLLSINILAYVPAATLPASACMLFQLRSVGMRWWVHLSSWQLCLTSTLQYTATCSCCLSSQASQRKLTRKC